MSEWISVKEKQPECWGFFLVLVDHPNSKKRGIYKLYLARYEQTYSTKIWRWDLGNTRSYETILKWSEKVHYWMNIPDSPEYIHEKKND